MSALLNASLRKSLADVTRRKGRTLLVVLGILIGVFGLTGINFADDAIFSAYTFTLGIRAEWPDINMPVEGFDPALLPMLSTVANVQAIQYQTLFQTQWHISTAPGHAAIDILSFPDFQHTPLTPFELVSGHYPGVGEIMLVNADQSPQPVQLGDTLKVDGAQGIVSLQVVGLVRLPGGTHFGGFMSDVGLQQLAESTSLQHVIEIKVQNSKHAQDTASRIATILQAHQVNLLRTDFPSVPILPLDQINGIFIMLRVLDFLALLMISILIINSVTTLITEQTAIIGTMKSLGGTRGVIMRGYLVSVGIYALLGTLPGLLLGLLSGRLLAVGLDQLSGLDAGPFNVAPQIVVLSLSVGFAIPLLGALLPLWNGTRISIRDSLAAYGVSAGRANRLFTSSGQRLLWISQTTWLGLHGIFRKRWRVVLTLLTLTLAGTCFLIVQTAASSVNYTVSLTHATQAADIDVQFSGTTSFSQVDRQLQRLPNLQRIEPYWVQGGTTQWGDVSMFGVEPQTKLYHSQLTGGHWLGNSDTKVALISGDVAAKTGLHIGNLLSVRNQNGQVISLTIIGTVQQPIDVLGRIGAIITPLATLYQFEGVSSKTPPEVIIQANDRSQSAVNQLASRIDTLVNPVGKIVSGVPTIGTQVETIQKYTLRRQQSWYILYSMLYAVALIVAAAGILGLATALTASVLERQREIGILRALGASGWRIAQVFLVESLALSCISWCVSALLGLPLAYLFVQMLRQLVLPIDFIVDPVAFVVMLIAVLFTAVLASVVPSWRASRMRIAEILRYE